MTTQLFACVSITKEPLPRPVLASAAAMSQTVQVHRANEHCTNQYDDNDPGIASYFHDYALVTREYIINGSGGPQVYRE